MGQLFIRITEAAERVSVSRTVAYELAHTEWRCFVIKVGRSLRVSARGLEGWAEDKLEEARRHAGQKEAPEAGRLHRVLEEGEAA